MATLMGTPPANAPSGVLDVKALMEAADPGLWDEVTNYFGWALDLTPEEAAEALTQLCLMFAVLLIEPTAVLVPSRRADTAWDKLAEHEGLSPRVSTAIVGYHVKHIPTAPNERMRLPLLYWMMRAIMMRQNCSLNTAWWPVTAVAANCQGVGSFPCSSPRN